MEVNARAGVQIVDDHNFQCISCGGSNLWAGRLAIDSDDGSEHCL